MITHRHWMALILVGAMWGGTMAPARAQEEAAPSSSGGTSSESSGASSAFPTTPTTTPTPAPTTPPASQPGSQAPTIPAPGTVPSGPTTDPAGTTTLPGSAPTSTFGQGTPAGGSTAPVEEAASFSLPGSYGEGTQTLTAGQGRFTRPRFRTTATVQLGYDDNVLSAPTKGLSVDAVTQEVLVDPGTPDTIRLVPLPRRRGVGDIFGNPGPLLPQEFRTEVVPGTPPEFETITLAEAIPAQERLGSFFARTSANFDIQMASRKQVFTLDLRLNYDYFFDRPGDQTDFNGGLSFQYARRLTPRMQYTASANLSYLSQPDVTRLNAPSRQVGAYFNVTAKTDLSYRWTKRFSSVSSLAYNSLIYGETTQESGNYYETTFGTEGRYLWGPRLTVLGEVRYSQIAYDQDPMRNSNTLFLLAGFETVLSRRISTTLRVGQSIRTFEETQRQALSPYLESTVSWRYGPTGFLNWNTRFGFEEPSDVNSTVLTLRTGLNLSQAFSARLRGTAGFTLLHRTTTSETSDIESTEDTLDLNLGLEYALSRRLSLNANYSYTQVISDNEATDYYRNRLFFGAEYTF